MTLRSDLIQLKLIVRNMRSDPKIAVDKGIFRLLLRVSLRFLSTGFFTESDGGS